MDDHVTRRFPPYDTTQLGRGSCPTRGMGAMQTSMSQRRRDASRIPLDLDLFFCSRNRIAAYNSTAVLSMISGCVQRAKSDDRGLQTFRFYAAVRRPTRRMIQIS